MSRKRCDSWTLVQFTEDKIWFACPPSRLRQKGDEYEAKWTGDGRWYPVVIDVMGDEQTVKKALDEVMGRTTGKRKYVEDCTFSRGTRRKGESRRIQPLSERTVQSPIVPISIIVENGVFDSPSISQEENKATSLQSPRNTNSLKDNGKLEKSSEAATSDIALTGLKNNKPSELPPVTTTIENSTEELEVCDTPGIYDYPTTISQSFESDVNKKSPSLVGSITCEDPAVPSHTITSIIDSTTYSSNNCSDKNQMETAQESPNNMICTSNIASTGLKNNKPSELPPVTSTIENSTGDLEVCDTPGIYDYPTTISHSIESNENKKRPSLARSITCEDPAVPSHTITSIIDSTTYSSNNRSDENQMKIAQECLNNMACALDSEMSAKETEVIQNLNSTNSTNLSISDISIFSQIDHSFIIKHGMENISDLSNNIGNFSDLTFESMPRGISLPKQVPTSNQDNMDVYQRSEDEVSRLADIDAPLLKQITPLQNITNISQTELNITKVDQNDSFSKDTNEKSLRKRITIQNVYSFSEEEPFIDSGSEYRPSNSYSDDTDGDSFRNKTHSKVGPGKKPEVLDIISTQMFDNCAPESVTSDVALQTDPNVFMATKEDDNYKNIPSYTIIFDENSRSSDRNQLNQMCSAPLLNNIELNNNSSVPEEIFTVATLTNSNNNSSVPEEVCTVATVTNSNARKWDKKFLCIYCKKFISKLPRHLYSNHKEEPEVVKILNLPMKSRERMKLLLEIQNRGIFFHNKNTIKEGKGSIIPKRRPRPEVKHSVKDYIPCPSCFQLYAKSYLSEHKNKCIFTVENSKGIRVQAQSMLLLPVGPEIPSKFKNAILSKMIVDDIFLVVRNDPLILQFGEAEFQKLAHENRYYRNISDRIRELGRLLIAARGIDSSVKWLSQLINANKYQLIKKSVKSIAGFNEDTYSFESPSLAIKLGISLKKCGILLRGDYMEDDDLRQLIPRIDCFLAVLEAKWTREINCHAHRTLSERKWNAPKRLPLAKDIQILHKYLKSNSDELFDELQQSSDPEVFQVLTEITLVRTLILNRRRVGEMQFILLSDYIKAKGAEPESDVFQTLSSSEKVLSKTLKRLVIKGKKGRGVPVLFTEDLQSNINLIVRVRNLCGVKLDNQYLFPSSRSTAGHFRAHTLLRKYAILAGCKEVQSITSTRLRKHIATMTQLLNLKDHELDSLAKFMGHDIRVHREYYRLSEETTQLAKVSKLLISLDKGNLNSLKGKNLDEINVDDCVEDAEESDGESDEEVVHSKIANVSEKSIPQSEFPNLNPPTENSKISAAESSNNSVTRENGNHGETKQKTKPKTNQNVNKRSQNTVRKPWSSEEKAITKRYFGDHLSMRLLPGKTDIESFLEKNSDVILDRKWNNVKDFLYNELKKIKQA